MTEDYWKNIAVIGAAGKMGKGIALILLQEMARDELKIKGSLRDSRRKLYLIDTDLNGTYAIKEYLRNQLKTFAERNINELRKGYASNPRLISNGEIIAEFVESAIDLLRHDNALKAAHESQLIFEAAVENVNAKIDIFKTLRRECHADPFYFTNTSSIPISLIDKESDLNHRIVGFHFYNPPPVQKLVEVVESEKISTELHLLAKDVGKRLGKTLVFSQDIAGFIGNGHFIREVAFACDLAQEIATQKPLHEAITEVNDVTKKLLLRPMGIFQLMDYVGIDICDKIAAIMDAYIAGSHLQRELIKKMIKSGNQGGQSVDGFQREGFFQYRHLVPIAIFDDHQGRYLSLEKELSDFQDSDLTWKNLNKDPLKKEKIAQHFMVIAESKSRSAEISRRFLIHSREIAELLINDHVAASMQDVNTVLEMGFFHLYGAEDFYLTTGVR